MASADPREERPLGRIIALHRPDVHVEARRLGAAAFDLLILAILQVWLDDVYGVTHVTAGSPLHQVGGYAYVTTASTIGAPWLALMVVAYFTTLEALFGATCGKVVAGLCVVDVTGRQPSFGAVIVRNLLRLIDWWPLFYLAGIVSAGLSAQRQRLGDRVARTLVVAAGSAVLAYRPETNVRRRVVILLAALAVFTVFSMGFSYWGRPPLVVEGLVNTNAIFGDRGIDSYHLGAASWGDGVVTYHISYHPVGARRNCAGLISLRWKGFFAFGGGWVPAGTASRCV